VFQSQLKIERGSYGGYNSPKNSMSRDQLREVIITINGKTVDNIHKNMALEIAVTHLEPFMFPSLTCALRIDSFFLMKLEGNHPTCPL